MSAETTSDAHQQVVRGGAVRRKDIDAGDAPTDDSFRELHGKPLAEKSAEVIDRIAAATRNNPLFEGMEEGQRAEIYASMVEIPVLAGQEVRRSPVPLPARAVSHSLLPLLPQRRQTAAHGFCHPRTTPWHATGLYRGCTLISCVWLHLVPPHRTSPHLRAGDHPGQAWLHLLRD